VLVQEHNNSAAVTQQLQNSGAALPTIAPAKRSHKVTKSNLVWLLFFFLLMPITWFEIGFWHRQSIPIRPQDGHSSMYFGVTVHVGGDTAKQS
jgi:hypothetical protein